MVSSVKHWLVKTKLPIGGGTISPYLVSQGLAGTAVTCHSAAASSIGFRHDASSEWGKGAIIVAFVPPRWAAMPLTLGWSSGHHNPSSRPDPQLARVSSRSKPCSDVSLTQTAIVPYLTAQSPPRPSPAVRRIIMVASTRLERTGSPHSAPR